MKKQPTEWEKIFTNNMTHKGLISNIYKQFMQLNIKKSNNQTKKRVKELNRHFSKEEVCRYSTLLFTREMQVKSTMRYHLTLVRMAIIKKNTNSKY